MKIGWNPSALREIKIHEYGVRFLFGGLCTVIAGIVAKHYGPAIGGLFLAFPAIFPASATMIENHEKRKKAKTGRDGTMRGRMAASIDAAGTARGAIGLAAFSLLVWKCLPVHNSVSVIAAAVLLWAITSYFLWRARRVLN
jgi:hypothetical protein